MMDGLRFPCVDREDFMTFDRGRDHRDAITAVGKCQCFWRKIFTAEATGRPPARGTPCLLQNDKRVLGFVRLLIASANQAFDSYGGFRPLALFEFCDPIGNGVDDVVRSLANGLGLAFAVNALSAFDDFYFFLGHKQLWRAGLQSG
jgi:hypothetical protein